MRPLDENNAWNRKRQAVLNSEAFKSGRPFLTSEMLHLMSTAVGKKVTSKEGSMILHALHREEVLGAVEGSSPKKWHKPLDHILSVPWRTLTNSQLGIKESFGLGWHGHV